MIYIIWCIDRKLCGLKVDTRHGCKGVCMRPSLSKKGVEQSTSQAFTLILIIMAFFLLYMILIPDEDRAQLLGNHTGNGTTSSSSVIIFSASNVQLSPDLLDDDFKLSLPSFELYSTFEQRSFLEFNPLHVTRSIIFNNKKTITFDVPDLETTRELNLHFKAEQASGRLRIRVNDHLISEIDASAFASKKDLSAPIIINKNILREQGNRIVFETTSPGIAFWRIHTFDLSFVTLFETRQVTNQQATLTFDFSKKELSNIEDVLLKYGVIMTTAQPIDIYLNNRLLFSGEPTTQGESTHKILGSDLKEHNVLSFTSKKGSYRFFDVRVEGDYVQDEERKYYFTVPEKKRRYIMEFDLVDATSKKQFYFYVNDQVYSIDTTDDLVSLDISGGVKRGRNEILFVPSDEIAIAQVKIVESR